MKCRLSCAVCAMGLLTAGAYTYEADFTVTDGRDGTPSMERRRETIFSHGHYEVKDGAYAILVSGNRHYFATPKLRDFRLELEMTFARLLEVHYDLGFWLRFRDDRAGRDGHVLRVAWQADGTFAAVLDGKEVYRDATPFPPQEFSIRPVLDVRGNRGTLAVAGKTIPFSLPSEDAPGYVSIDSIFCSAETLAIASAKLTSDEEPAKTPVGSWRLALGNGQGFILPPVYDVTLSRYASGETLVEAVLSGTQLSRGTNRLETGGREWSSFLERLTTPYVRLDAADGSWTHRLNFWQGMKQFADPLVRKNQNIPWPKRVTAVLRDVPADLTVAAGYERAVCNPWRWLADGPYEQIQDRKGTRLYEGPALSGGRVSVRAVSPDDKKMTRLVPTDIPDYAAALRHARQQHYFFESERVRFRVETTVRAADYLPDELSLGFRLTDVFGGAAVACTAKPVDAVELPGGFRRLRHEVTLAKNPGCGVWHLWTDVSAGGVAKTSERTVFEVLSDDPNGPCPPLASGLPEFVSMPNEVKYLEEDAFDPWQEHGGISHYYATVNRYPAVGNRSEIWRLLPLYRRRWFCWSFGRNTSERDIRNAFNRDLMKHCDVFGGEENGTPIYDRYDFAYNESYTGLQLQILRDYVAERKPALKRLTVEELDRRLAKKKGVCLSAEELRELVETCWNDFIAYARARADRYTAAFDDFVWSQNPKAGRGSYGPMSIYTSHYKSAYHLFASGRSPGCDPRLRQTDSFWLLEEYHFSCDYPICRGAFYVTSYDMLFPKGRKIYPEIYYTGWGRCLDGAVYRAHPSPGTPISSLHQRRIVYQYGYGTPHFRDGKYKYWTDDGFHARNPEREAMDEFVHAWGNLRAARPVASPKAPFVMLDVGALRRHGDYFEDQCNLHMYSCNGRYWDKTDVCNTAEEGLAYAFEKCSLAGYATPVMSDFAELDRLTNENAEFVVLPPIGAGTPPETLAAIRRLHARGVGLLASERVVGLEDLFGVREDPAGPRKVVAVAGDEAFEHKLALARYLATDAETVLAGRAEGAETASVPLVLRREKGGARTVFVNVPPTVVRRAGCRDGFSFGQSALSEAMARAYRDAFAYLAPTPALRVDRGSLMTGFAADGSLAVAISDDAPIYHDTTAYPVPVALTIRQKGIGLRTVTADVPFAFARRQPDEVVIRTTYEKDAANFFRFSALRTETR